jgi:hypothetical protein
MLLNLGDTAVISPINSFGRGSSIEGVTNLVWEKKSKLSSVNRTRHVSKCVPLWFAPVKQMYSPSCSGPTQWPHPMLLGPHVLLQGARRPRLVCPGLLKAVAHGRSNNRCCAAQRHRSPFHYTVPSHQPSQCLLHMPLANRANTITRINKTMHITITPTLIHTPTPTIYTIPSIRDNHKNLTEMNLARLLSQEASTDPLNHATKEVYTDQFNANPRPGGYVLRLPAWSYFSMFTYLL